MKVLFLFGAGASAYSGECYPTNPPLGADLFEVMEKEGLVPSSIDTTIRNKFIKDFEEGMYLLNEQGSQFYNPFQRNLAKFFARFSPGRSNFYCQLLGRLKQRNFLWKTTFSTLNYDCLIERSTSALSIPMRYGPRCLVEAKDVLPVYKVHGSCGFLPNLMGVTLNGCTFKGSKSDVDAPVQSTFQQKEITDWCDNPAMNSISPAMAMYMKGKRRAYCPSHIELHYTNWKRALNSCSHCFIIGVRFSEEDNHIWQPCLEAKCVLNYIDPKPSNFMEWAKQNNREKVFHYSDTFEQALDLIIEDVKMI